MQLGPHQANRNIIEINPTNTSILIKIAQLWGKRKNTSQAILNYYKAFTLEPENRWIIKQME